MKVQPILRLFVILLAAITVSMTGCKKDETKPPAQGNTESLQQLSIDDNNIQSISDENMNDAMTVVTGGNLKSSNMMWPCNATVDSANLVNDTIVYYITYNGLNCLENFYRTGQVVVKRPFGVNWIDPGATVKVDLVNFHITRVATGKSVTLNGSHLFTNVSGGHIWMLGYGLDALVQRAEGYMHATFDDSTTRTWYIARQRTLTGAIGTLVLSIDGFGNAGSYNNLVTWGTNRNGEEFFAQINQTVVHKQACNFDPVTGIIHYAIPAGDKSATITFGYDSNNQPVTNDDCPAKYRLDWQYNGNSGTFYLWLH
jgi:hypothetical protein